MRQYKNLCLNGLFNTFSDSFGKIALKTVYQHWFTASFRLCILLITVKAIVRLGV